MLTIAATSESGNASRRSSARSANAFWHSATVYAPVAINAPWPSESLTVESGEDGQPGGRAEVGGHGGELEVAERLDGVADPDQQEPDDEHDREVAQQGRAASPVDGSARVDELLFRRQGRPRGAHTRLAATGANSPPGRTSSTASSRTSTASGVRSLPA